MSEIPESRVVTLQKKVESLERTLKDIGEFGQDNDDHKYTKAEFERFRQGRIKTQLIVIESYQRQLDVAKTRELLRGKPEVSTWTTTVHD